MENNQQKTLKVVLCQTHPQLKKKAQNIHKFDQHLQYLCQQDNIDIFIFPQMSFTGYNFENYEDALPHAVFYCEGLQFEYARNLSLRLKAYVLIGYIEKFQKNGKVVLYNSAAICDRQGKFIFNTRKTHLYFADELWAQEGEGFKELSIKNTKGQVFTCAVGICMDINQKHFTSNKREFADFIKAKDSEVILLPTNWIDSDRKDKNSSQKTYNYWLNRLRPLLQPHSNKKRLFLVANRAGEEYSYYDKQNFWFMGSSCALSLNPQILIDRLDKDKQFFLKVQVSLPISG